MESTNEISKVQTDEPILELDDENFDELDAEDYEEENNPEGYVNSNGVIAYYVHGEVYTDRFYGLVTNLSNAGIVPEGDSIDDYRKDVRSMVHSLFEGFDQYGKPRRKINAAGTLNATIEFYVEDPVILDFFYNRYPHKKVPHKTYVVPLHPL
jgi:hypothetical protein